jgi:hypothetical protein
LAVCLLVTALILYTFRTLFTTWLSAESIDPGRPYWTLHLISCQTPDAVTTVFECSWGWKHIASETCRVVLQLLINILPSCITLVLYIYSIFKFNSSTDTPMLMIYFQSFNWEIHGEKNCYVGNKCCKCIHILFTTNIIREGNTLWPKEQKAANWIHVAT